MNSNINRLLNKNNHIEEVTNIYFKSTLTESEFELDENRVICIKKYKNGEKGSLKLEHVYAESDEGNNVNRDKFILKPDEGEYGILIKENNEVLFSTKDIYKDIPEAEIMAEFILKLNNPNFIICEENIKKVERTNNEHIIQLKNKLGPLGDNEFYSPFVLEDRILALFKSKNLMTYKDLLLKSKRKEPVDMFLNSGYELQYEKLPKGVIIKLNDL